MNCRVFRCTYFRCDVARRVNDFKFSSATVRTQRWSLWSDEVGFSHVFWRCPELQITFCTNLVLAASELVQHAFESVEANATFISPTNVLQCGRWLLSWSDQFLGLHPNNVFLIPIASGIHEHCLPFASWWCRCKLSISHCRF